MWWIWAALRSVAAEPACEPLDETEFLRIVGSANAFIGEDAPAAHALAAQSLDEKLPCLTFVPSPNVWAGYLVGVAAVAYLRGAEWQPALETALTVAPDIDRAVGADHEIALWTPPPPPK